LRAKPLEVCFIDDLHSKIVLLYLFCRILLILLKNIILK
jgi:hypothetical protein